MIIQGIINDVTVCSDESFSTDSGLGIRKKANYKDKFIGGKFRSQMNKLSQEISQSDCHFVRCIKPND